MESALDGIGDTLDLLREAAIVAAGRSPGRVVTTRQLESALQEARALLARAPGSFSEWGERLASLSRHAETLGDVVLALQQEDDGPQTGRALEWAQALRRSVAGHASDYEAMRGRDDPAEAFARRLAAVAAVAGGLVEEMDFSFLLDRRRELFSIGYRLSDRALDPGHYDLLASEARLASFVAIARGDAPGEHWFHLSRPLRSAADRR